MFRSALLLALVMVITLTQAQALGQADKPRPARKQPANDAIAALIEQRRYAEARRLIEDALKGNPNDANLYLLLAEAYSETGRLEEAVKACEQAIDLDAALLPAYSIKWESMLKRPDFETQAPLIGAEIEKLLARNQSEPALGIAATGFELLADEEAVRKVHDRVIAAYPNSEWTQAILGGRAFAEPDREKRAALFETFIARYPADAGAGMIYADLFRTRANQPLIPTRRLREIGEAWIRAVTPTIYAAIAARAKVALVLAERREGLDQAEAIADEAAGIVRRLTSDSLQVAGEPAAGRAALISRLNEEAQVALGFVHLRQGRTQEAAGELSGPLRPVSLQVERDGYVLWKDADLREYGLRPRVFWLAELFEAQGDYARAAKYLLAGAGDDDRLNQLIQSRLPAIYAKLGRSPSEATAGLNEAVQRYRRLTTPTTALRDSEKAQLLGSRTEATAPDFKALGLDKKEIRLADFKGKVAVLVFWATWCGPCVAELPHFQEAVKKYAANQDVAFLAVSTDEHKLAVRPFIERKGYRMPVAYDISGAASLEINAIPALIIIDRKGRVAFREQGFGGEAERYVERLSWRVDELLKEIPAASSQSGQR